MELVQFLQENNEVIENEYLLKENKKMSRNNNNSVSSNNNNNNSNNSFDEDKENEYNKNNDRKHKEVRIEYSNVNDDDHNDENTNNNTKDKSNQIHKVSSFANSFTDYSSVDCDSLTDSSYKWTQNESKTENKSKSRYYNNQNYEYAPQRKPNDESETVEDEITEDIQQRQNSDDDDDENYTRIVIDRNRPKISRNRLTVENDEYRPSPYDRPITRRGRTPDLPKETKNSADSDYVELAKCGSTQNDEKNEQKNNDDGDDEIDEELISEEKYKTIKPKVENENCEVFNFDEIEDQIDHNQLYTPPLAIEETIIESDSENQAHEIEYITVDKISSNHNVTNNTSNSNRNDVNRNNNNNNKNNPLPQIFPLPQRANTQINMKTSNNKILNQRDNRNMMMNQHYRQQTQIYPSSLVRQNDMQFQRNNTFTNGNNNNRDMRLFMAHNRERLNISRNTNKSADSKTTSASLFTTRSLHLRKMNQEEIQQSVNRLYYVPKKPSDQQRFKTIHDRSLSKNEIDAVSLRLYSSYVKSNKNKDNEKPKKYLSKIEIDKMIERLIARSDKVPESCRVIKKSDYKSMGLIQSYAWKGYN